MADIKFKLGWIQNQNILWKTVSLDDFFNKNLSYITDVKPVHKLRYVGLNEKEGYGDAICEGDILKINLPVGGFWGNEPKEKVGLVRYEEERGGFIVEWEYSKHQHFIELDCDIAYTSTILGNKYNNPQLLETYNL